MEEPDDLFLEEDSEGGPKSESVETVTPGGTMAAGAAMPEESGDIEYLEDL